MMLWDMAFPVVVVVVGVCAASTVAPTGPAPHRGTPLRSRRAPLRSGLADLVEAARHRGDDPSAHLERLEQVRERHPHVMTEVHERDEGYARVIAALDAVYGAEVARARPDGDAARVWGDAVGLLAQTELAWDEAYARP